jgi:hypothetical protein
MHRKRNISALCKLQKGCTRLAADIAEILLKVALKHQKIKSKANARIRARKEILRVILDLRFTITLVKRSPDVLI